MAVICGGSDGVGFIFFATTTSSSHTPPVSDPAPVPQGCETACEFSVGLGALLLLLVALRAQGAVRSACGSCRVSVEVLWAGAEECGSWQVAGGRW